MSRFTAAAGVAVAAVALTTAACATTAPTTQTSGTASASAPADGSAPVTGGAAQVKVTLTNNGSDTCAADFTTAPAGPVTFTVENVSASGITEVELQNELKILGEKENLAPGLPASSFTVTLDGGTYTLYCLGATPKPRRSPSPARPPRRRPAARRRCSTPAPRTTPPGWLASPKS